MIFVRASLMCFSPPAFPGSSSRLLRCVMFFFGRDDDGRAGFVIPLSTVASPSSAFLHVLIAFSCLRRQYPFSLTQAWWLLHLTICLLCLCRSQYFFPLFFPTPFLFFFLSCVQLGFQFFGTLVSVFPHLLALCSCFCFLSLVL